MPLLTFKKTFTNVQSYIQQDISNQYKPISQAGISYNQFCK
jgi:hypothetical protein